MKTKFENTKYFTYTIFSIMIIFMNVQYSKSVTNPTEVIWYEKYVDRSVAAPYDYHILGMKAYAVYTQMDHTVPPKPRNTNPYLVVYKKDSTAAPNQIVRKMYLSNRGSYDFLSFYFPLMNGTHVKPYVIFGVSIDCLGFTKYKIKFFNCDTQATNFYTYLGTTTKLKFLLAGGFTGNYNTPCGSRGGAEPVTDAATLITLFNGTLKDLTETDSSCALCTFA
jgi:hypothetical protein